MRATTQTGPAGEHYLVHLSSLDEIRVQANRIAAAMSDVVTLPFLSRCPV